MSSIENNNFYNLNTISIACINLSTIKNNSFPKLILFNVLGPMEDILSIFTNNSMPKVPSLKITNQRLT